LGEAGLFSRLAEKSADLEIGIAGFETLGELRIASGACLVYLVRSLIYLC